MGGGGKLGSLWLLGGFLLLEALLVTSTGRLELHGCPRASWQYLEQTAFRGDTKIVLPEAVHLAARKDRRLFCEQSFLFGIRV